MHNTAFTVGVRSYLIRRTLEDIITLIILSVGVLAAIIYALYTQRGLDDHGYNVYYPINANGQVIQQTNLSRKNYTDTDAQNFALKALQLSYNYNYTNWRYQFNRLAPMFSLKDWEQYEATLEKHNLILSLKRDHLNIYSSVAGKTSLLGSGVVNNAYMWRFKTPIVMNYKTNDYAGTQGLDVIITVAEANPDFYPSGLRVVSIAAYQN